jgi:F0F1-type ATP synthase assembly protein I
MSEPPGERPSRSAAGHRDIGEAVGHTVASGAFFGSLMAGLLLGWIADRFLDTRPVFIVIGIVAGAVVGFWRMWVDYGRGG